MWRNPWIKFLCLFVPLYGALVAPWPGWDACYGRGFRSLCRVFLASEGPAGLVRFQGSPPGKPLDTEIVLLDPGAGRGAGAVRERILGLDSRGVGWIPTALLLSLILATPVAWRRRARALCIGMPLVHGYIVSTAAVYIWSESLRFQPGPAGTGPGGFLGWIAGALEETLVVQLGASFVVPAMIWILLTFDLRGMIGLGGGGKPVGTDAEGTWPR